MPGVWKLRRRMSTGSVGAGPAPRSAAISGRVTAVSGFLHGWFLRLTMYTIIKKKHKTNAAIIGTTTQISPCSAVLTFTET